MSNTEKYHTKFFKRLDAASRRKPVVGAIEVSRLGVLTWSKLRDSTFKKIAKDRRDARRQKTIDKKIQEVIQRTARRKEVLDAFVECTWQKYHLLWKYNQTPETLRRHSRDLANTLYDLPTLWTGFSSIDSINIQQKIEEHFHPRQWAGTVVLDHIIVNKGITREEIKIFFDILRQIHYTTREENMRLRAFQKAHDFDHWKESYNKANITLIQEMDNGPVKSLSEFFDHF